MSKLSEAEDDPEVYESSGEEWDSDSAKGKKKNNRRTSARQPKKPKRMAESESSEGEEEDENSEGDPPPKKKSKNGTNKKAKPKEKAAANSAGSEEDAEEEEEEDIDEEEEEEEDEDEEEDEGSAEENTKGRKTVPKTINSAEYEPGSFVILRKDAQVEPSKHPNIWRIDGKALLQKYEAFDEDGKVRHRNTSIYTGWSPMDQELYAPVTVDVVKQKGQDLTVELQWDKLKDIEVYSDEEEEEETE
nr:unnamed protein product [Callosobruchus analis]